MGLSCIRGEGDKHRGPTRRESMVITGGELINTGDFLGVIFGGVTVFDVVC